MGELVDITKPGDRIQVNGVYKCLVTGKTMFSGVFSTKIIATGVELIKEDDTQEFKNISNKIKKLSKDIEAKRELNENENDSHL